MSWTPTSTLPYLLSRDDSTNTTSTVSSTATCISVTPDSNGYVPEYACGANYNYYPSFSAAVLFALLFGLSTLVHVIQAIVYRKVRLCWVLIMGGLWEFVSFALRSAGSKDQQSTSLAISSQILVLLAPMWVNAFVYMVLGRMIHFFILPDRKIWGFKAAQLAKFFVWLDILSFLTQLGGGSLIQPGQDTNVLLLGIHLYMGGIGMQEFWILVFTAVAVRFWFVLRHIERSGLLTHDIPAGPLASWRWLLIVLLASLALITTRIIFRLVEFSSGLDPSVNPIPFTEAYFYVLDALPMVLAMVLINIVHPGRIMTGPDSEFPRLTRAEKKELKRTRKAEKRVCKEAKLLKLGDAVAMAEVGGSSDAV
jgi:RTA1 like protein